MITGIIFNVISIFGKWETIFQNLPLYIHSTLNMNLCDYRIQPIIDCYKK